MGKKLTKREQDLKMWYKQYSDLPVDIIKQIIVFKSKQTTPRINVEAVKSLNIQISKYKKALQDFTEIREQLKLNSLFIDFGYGYGGCMGISECIEEVNRLKRLRRSLIDRYKFEHMKRSF